jgi:hypothetical protein
VVAVVVAVTWDKQSAVQVVLAVAVVVVLKGDAE